MAKLANELLSDIFGVLSKIDSKLDKIGAGASGIPGSGAGAKKAKASDVGMNLNDQILKKDKSAQMKETAEAIKILSSSIGELSKGLIKFGLIPKSVRSSFKEFIVDLLQSSTLKGGIKANIAAKTSAEAMGIIAEALPKLAKGVRSFGLVSWMVPAVVVGITSLMGAMAATAEFAVPATATAAALAGLGMALNGLANVLKSIAIVILAFAGAIVIMVGAIYLATTLFKLEGQPLKAMGIIVGSIAILAGGFALIGMLAPLIIGAGVAIAAMGIGLALMGVGLLIYMGSLGLLVDKLGGIGKFTLAMLAGAAFIGLMGLAFAGLGILSVLIIPGAIAAQHMGKGLLWVAGGLLAIGGVYALLTKVFGISVMEMALSVAGMLAVLGLTFAGLGLFVVPIMIGLVPAIAMAITLGIFALSMLGVGAIIDKMGPDGLSNLKENITLLIGGTIGGVLTGMSEGLLGKKGGITSLADLGKIGVNTLALIGTIGLLSGVSVALILFATALRGFQKVGVIQDKDGKDINVIDVAGNIAKSIGSFFTILVDLFKNPDIIPSATKMAYISQLLMGVKGPKLLGIRLYSAEVPGIIDALLKFGEVLTMYSKINQIPQYTVNANGEPKITSYIKPQDIAYNIGQTVKSFFTGISDTFKDRSIFPSPAEMTNIATLLMGYKGPKFLGMRLVSSGEPNIIDALLKFGEVLTMYSKINQIPIYTVDDKGNQKIEKFVGPEIIAGNIASSVKVFFTSLNKEFTVIGSIISGAKLQSIATTLMGYKGPKILGMRLFNTEVPSVMDAISKFGEVLTLFAKINQLPIYGINSKGEPIVTGYTNPSQIASNIVSAIKTFFTGFSNVQNTLADISSKTTMDLSQILLGSEATKGWFGRTKVEGKPGILDPINQFIDMINKYAKLGKNNQIPTEYDAKGNPVAGKYMTTSEIAKNIVSGISSFLNAFNTELGTSGGSIEKQSKIIGEKIKMFSSIIGEFSKLAEAQEGIDKLANSTGLLATNIGTLTTSLGLLDTVKLEKLATITAQHAVTTKGIPIAAATTINTTSAASAAKTPEMDWDKIGDIIGQKIAEKLSSSKSSSYNFQFYNQTGGKLEIGQT